jgi:hypothetical protein
MRLLSECDDLDRASLTAEIKERRELLCQMVGTLYPGIVHYEIAKLDELLWNHPDRHGPQEPE